MNRVMLAGYVLGEPDRRDMAGGKSFYVIKVVTTRYFKNEPNLDTIEISCFGRAAKVAEEYLRDGLKVVVEGSVRSREWKDKTFLSVVADTITPVEALGGEEPKKNQELSEDELSLDSDDIPF